MQTLRIQGAFNDAIDWFGLADFAHDVEDVYREVKRGVKSTGEIARDVLVDTLIKGPVNKIVGSITPFFKTSAELLFKRSLYPDAFNARPLRDRWEHAASSVALTIPFKAAAGRPTGGFFNQIQGVVVNTYDPGEQQYHTSVNRVFKFLKDKGKDTGARSPSKRSNALFYWRKSLALGEPEKADKFIELYIELSEKEKIKDPGAGIRNVIKNLNPLNRIPENLRQEFKNEMDVKDLRALEDGQAWVKRVFDPKKVQAITPIKKKKR